MNGHCKRLKALIRVEPAYLNAAQIPEYRFMLGETNVNHIPSVGNSLAGKRFCKGAEFLQI